MSQATKQRSLRGHFYRLRDIAEDLAMARIDLCGLCVSLLLLGLTRRGNLVVRPRRNCAGRLR